MSNTCYTTIRIKANPQVISIFSRELEDATVKNGWLGNLLLHLGYTEGNFDNIICRGDIVYTDIDDDCIHIDTETAWSPLLKVFTTFCDQYAEGKYELIYTAEEPGCELFYSNDPDVVGTWYIDVYGYDAPEGWQDIECSGWSDKSANELFSEALGKKQGDTKTLAKEITQKYEDVSIHQYEYASVGELD